MKRYLSYAYLFMNRSRVFPVGLQSALEAEWKIVGAICKLQSGGGGGGSEKESECTFLLCLPSWHALPLMPLKRHLWISHSSKATLYKILYMLNACGWYPDKILESCMHWMLTVSALNLNKMLLWYWSVDSWWSLGWARRCTHASSHM